MKYWQLSALALWVSISPVAFGEPTLGPTGETRPETSNPSSKLEIGDMILIREQAGLENRFVIKGTVTNQGDQPMRLGTVSFREYRQEGEELVEVNQGEMTVAPEEISPGLTGNFGQVFTQEPQVLLIVEFTGDNRAIPVNQCYSGTLLGRETCRRQFDTRSTFPFARP
ncbi:MAG: hypothetical protein HC825_09660 [Oscillatoriales cyanobacterium RM1_1_9]|nr:hypothetical protein [Oscillatoriales cyanobacterium SM2_3_0]NJO46423.1 hypothetical protein [Oscillatoriales cyanobacterium RM2_1_1]NJO71860.1 hypothetical protein [Oscillatoriales cyanobacterium RM1_1_9]